MMRVRHRTTMSTWLRGRCDPRWELGSGNSCGLARFNAGEHFDGIGGCQRPQRVILLGVVHPAWDGDQRVPDINARGVLSSNHAVNRVTADPSDLETQVNALWAFNAPGEELELNTFLRH